jgi:hypothetical protein
LLDLVLAHSLAALMLSFGGFSRLTGFSPSGKHRP